MAFIPLAVDSYDALDGVIDFAVSKAELESILASVFIPGSLATIQFLLW